MDKGTGVRGKKSVAIEQPSVLDAMATAVHRSLKLEDVLDIILDIVMDAVEGTSGAEIHLYDNRNRTLFIKAHRGLPPWLIETGADQSEDGLVGIVSETGNVLFIEDLVEDARLDSKRIRREKLQSYCGVPIVCDDAFLGVLSAFTSKPTVFSPDQQSLLFEIGCRSGQAVKNALTFEQAAIRTRRFITISRAITVTRQLGTLEDVLQDISKVLVQSLGFDQSWIALVEPSSQTLHGKAGFGMGAKAKITSVDKIKEDGTHPAITAVVGQKPVVFRSMEDAPAGKYLDRLRQNGVQSFSYIPILSDEMAVGVIGVFYTTN